MVSDPRGVVLLKEKPVIDSSTLNLPLLRSLPKETLGKKYVDYMDDEGISADSRSPVRYVYNDELSYIMLRYRQVHDFLHVLTGLPITLPGEAGLKHFEWHHFKLPMCLLSASVATLSPTVISRLDDHRFLQDRIIPWAARAAAASDFLLAVPFEQYVDEDVDAVRKRINLEKAPLFPDPASAASSASSASSSQS